MKIDKQYLEKYLKVIFCVLGLFHFTACNDFADVFQTSQSHEVNADGKYYLVKRGDSLGSISKRYHLSVQELAEVNDLRSNRRLVVGQQLYIPRSHKKGKELSEEVVSTTPASAPVSAVGQAQEESPTFDTTRFIWPVNGVVTSRFGVRHGRQHDGIDIGAPRGTKVISAASGRVVHAGKLSGYGNLVVVKHADNFFTAYGHLSSFAVREGDRVKQGDSIGTVGNTGRSSGPHCHFEIRQRTEARNPLFFLPEKK